MENINYYIASFIAGLVAKMYDDISDNEKLYKFKNEFLLELLKGIHYIFFTIISLKEPFFLLISLLANVLNLLSNYQAFNKPYEFSLVSLFLLVFFIDYTNVNFINYINVIKKCIYFCLALFLEPYFIKEEVSVMKLCVRTIVLIYCIFFSLFLDSNEPFDIYLLFYIIGYILFSVIVQFYSLYIHKEDDDNKLEQEDNKLEQEDNKLEQEDNKLEQEDNKLEQEDNKLEQEDNKLEQEDNKLEQEDNKLEQEDK
jgi:Skp family chaperone for outer membrane proteins